MGYYVRLIVGLGLFLGGFAAFEVALANLLEVGTCASGTNTPYAIAQPCPEGTFKYAAMLPAGIIGGLIGAGIYAFRGDRPGGDLFDPPIGFGTVAWALLFCGTGLVCIYMRVFSDVELQAGAKFATIFIAALFIPMGLAPIAFGIWSSWDDRDSARRRASNPNLATSGGSGDSLAKIERLNKLRKSGALTQSEFDAEKAKLLSG
ncbi:MAG: SHOCT domain-containing protein [Solirubrobacterales bacterium]